MGEQQFEYLKELGTTLFNCSKNKLLCDLIILTEGREVFAHSVILAAVSSKLRVAFEHYGGAKRNSIFRYLNQTLNFPKILTCTLTLSLLCILYNTVCAYLNMKAAFD